MSEQVHLWLTLDEVGAPWWMMPAARCDYADILSEHSDRRQQNLHKVAFR
ncbi:MAG: hypothetical protein ABI129_06610 [Rhodanobacter sp.]